MFFLYFEYGIIVKVVKEDDKLVFFKSRLFILDYFIKFGYKL